MTVGVVHLVGAGPGDPGLLTLRGAALLRRADVVIYDGLVSPELLRHAPATAEIVFGGKHDRSRCVAQDELNALLLAQARAGKRVVRLKGGDPYLFGRGGEEAMALAEAQIPFEVVPGVSSLQAVPACAGIPLTHGELASAVTVVTGHEPPASPDGKLDWAPLARAAGTLVVLMGLRNLRAIAATLVAHGRAPDTPVAVVSRGTTARQRTLAGTLANIADLADRAPLAAPAVIVIGGVVNLRASLNWFESRPLFGRRVVVTQRSDLAAPTIARLRELGADVLALPATRWGPPADARRRDAAVAGANGFDWILFSHPFAVDHFLARLVATRGDVRALGRARLGAYGPATGERLRAWHLRPAAVAADHKTPLILDAVTRCGAVRGQRFLVVRGETALEQVPEALTALGATAEIVTGFGVEPETGDTPIAADFGEHGADWIVFASGLAIEHFHARFDLRSLLARFPHTRLAITTVTIQWALDELGLEPAVVTMPNDVEGLVTAIINATSATNPRPANKTVACA